VKPCVNLLLSQHSTARCTPHTAQHTVLCVLCSVLLCSVLLCSVLLCSVLLCSDESG
jgi:hypothetical protein